MPEVTIHLPDEAKAAGLLLEALNAELQRLMFSLEQSKRKLLFFENKYQISSDIFASDWAAEDLDGKDLEYIEWAGEYDLAKRLQERVEIINTIQHEYN